MSRKPFTPTALRGQWGVVVTLLGVQVVWTPKIECDLGVSN